MRVTLMTDASHCPETRAAGYGFWVVSARGGRPGEGVLRVRPADSTEAEMMAIARSLKQAIQWGCIEKDDQVLIQTDSMNSIRKFLGQTRCSALERQALQVMNSLTVAHKLVIEYRHVKAHSKIGDQRSKANEMCDLRAKRQMRAERARIRGGGDELANDAPA